MHQNALLTSLWEDRAFTKSRKRCFDAVEWQVLLPEIFNDQAWRCTWV